MNVDSLAAFKRFLAQPGATLTLRRHDFVPPSHPNHEVMFRPRGVAALTATKVGLRMDGKPQPSWLNINRAADFRFHGDRVTVDLSEEGTFQAVMVYGLSITQPSEPAEG